MPVDNPNPTSGSTPVVKATAIGQKMVGALCDFPFRRDRLKDGQPQINERTGKPRQQLVLTMVAMPGTTTVVGKAGEERPVVEGEVVRMILNGGAFGSFIEAEGAHKAISPSGARVGDVVEWDIEFAQAWNEDATKRGGELRTQAEADKVPRNVSLGFYGPISLRAATAAEAQWDEKACQMYRDSDRPTRPTTTAYDTADHDDEAPF